MHVVMRRVPVERARHAKRLGHVQAGALPVIVPSISPTATTTSSSSSTTPSSSSALSTTTSTSTTTTITPSSSLPTSSVVTPSSTFSVTSTSSTRSPTLTQPSSISIQPSTLTSTYPTSSPIPTPQAYASAPNNGLSGGAIAGIIAGAVIVGVALVVFFVRKTYLRRRERKRISWDRAPQLGESVLDEPKFPDISEQSTTTLNTPQRSAPLSPFEAHGQSMYPTPVAPAVRMQPPTSPYVVPSPPQATYNNLTPVAAYPTLPIRSTYSHTPTFTVGRIAAGTPLPSAHAQHMPREATVKCTFLPTLPDELSITTGERVFIVEQYDDGWDLCSNVRGERGMVPHECLERTPSDQPDIGWMHAGRMSSLNPNATRF